MKKIKTYILTFLLITMIIGISQTNTQAQSISIGIKEGGNLNTQSFTSNFFKIPFVTKSVLGYNIGAYLKVKLATFVIQPELLYATEGSNVNLDLGGVGSVSTDITYGYLRLPILVGVHIRKLSILAGPSFGFLLNNEKTCTHSADLIGSFTPGDNPSDYDIGLTIGADFQVLNKVSTGVRYNLGLTNVIKNEDANEEAKNRNFQFSITYTLFEIGI